MTSQTTDGVENQERLRANYRGAFDDWALQITHLQTVSRSNPDSLVMKEAEQRAAVAEIAYRSSRDRLTEDMAVVAGTDTPISKAE